MLKASPLPPVARERRDASRLVSLDQRGPVTDRQTASRSHDARLHVPEATLDWGTVRQRYQTPLAEIRRLSVAIDVQLPLQDRRRSFDATVSFEDACDHPVHRWYFYKEGFSPRLLRLMLQEIEIPAGGILLDPFAGVGTTVLSAIALPTRPFEAAVGVEHNPFAAFVGRTKVTGRGVPAQIIQQLGDAVLDHLPVKLPPIPPSTTIRNSDIYPRHRLDELRRLSAAIDELSHGIRRDLLRLALASILEPASNARKDGRALRIVPSDERVSVRDLFKRAVRDIAADLRGITMTPLGSSRLPASIYRGDARALPKQIGDKSVSLALFSPPYLNAIDYSEVYKVEEYFLGFVKDKDALYRVRQGTLRSHPSIRTFDRDGGLEALPAENLVRQLTDRIAEFLEAEEDRSFQAQYAWMIPGYFGDMHAVLKELERVLMPGGVAICVVANSMLADSLKVRVGEKEYRRDLWRIPVATDAIIAALGREAGLETIGGIWARSLRPRNAKAGRSRETLVIMQKPDRLTARRQGLSGTQAPR
jgi:DNA modification methylase